jgi:hypothetical protein
MSADADLGEPVIEFVQRDQQVEGVLELRGGSGPVPADNEDARDPGLTAASDDGRQVRAVKDLPGRQVRRDGITVAGQPYGEVDGCVLSFRGRRGNGQRHIFRHVRQHVRTRFLERNHLVAEVPKGLAHRLVLARWPGGDLAVHVVSPLPDGACNCPSALLRETFP